jgi:hypothetical protein
VYEMPELLCVGKRVLAAQCCWHRSVLRSGQFGVMVVFEENFGQLARDWHKNH